MSCARIQKYRNFGGDVHGPFGAKLKKDPHQDILHTE